MKKVNKPVKAYKGFNKHMQCTPNLYYFDQEWHVSWIDSAEGDCLCDFVGKSPEEAIINAHRSIIITDNSIKFL